MTQASGSTSAASDSSRDLGRACSFDDAFGNANKFGVRSVEQQILAEVFPAALAVKQTRTEPNCRDDTLAYVKPCDIAAHGGDISASSCPNKAGGRIIFAW
jgi:hypothetical protein